MLFMVGTYLFALLLLFWLLTRSDKNAAREGSVLPDFAYRELASPCRPLLSRLASMDTFMECGPMGLGSLKVVAAEAGAPYRTVADLSRFLAEQPKPGDLNQGRAIIKGLYQLSATLNLPWRVLDPCIDVVVGHLSGLSLFGKPIESIRKIKPGEPVNTKWMRPLNRGTTVAYPLGVAALSEGTVVAKADVYCR